MPERQSVGVVLCGDLNMVRCFSAAALAQAKLGAPCPSPVVVSTRPKDPVFSSRHVGERAVVADPAQAPEQTARDLEALGARLGGRPALFFGTDAMLLCVSRNRERLSRHFRFLLPPEERVEEVVDKTRFAKLAERLDLPVPQTLTSREVTDAESVLARLPLPVALKPGNHTGFRRSAAVREEGGLPRKALFAWTPAELETRLAQMRRSGGDFVVQSYVPGGDDAITSFHAWISASGEVRAHYVGKKIRTYPAGSGESTFIELGGAPDVVSQGHAIVRALGLVGVVKLDFKRHARTNELFLLECNPRFNLWNRLGAASGVNLPLIAYADLAGLSEPPPRPLRQGIRWAAFEADLRAFLHDYGPMGVLSLRAWLASYRGPVVYDVFAWDDPLPLAVSLLQRVGQRAARLARQGLGASAEERAP